MNAPVRIELEHDVLTPKTRLAGKIYLSDKVELPRCVSVDVVLVVETKLTRPPIFFLPTRKHTVQHVLDGVRAQKIEDQCYSFHLAQVEPEWLAISRQVRVQYRTVDTSYRLCVRVRIYPNQQDQILDDSTEDDDSFEVYLQRCVMESRRVLLLAERPLVVASIPVPITDAMRAPITVKTGVLKQDSAESLAVSGMELTCSSGVFKAGDTIQLHGHCVTADDRVSQVICEVSLIQKLIYTKSRNRDANMQELVDRSALLVQQMVLHDASETESIRIYPLSMQFNLNPLPHDCVTHAGAGCAAARHYDLKVRFLAWSQNCCFKKLICLDSVQIPIVMASSFDKSNVYVIPSKVKKSKPRITSTSSVDARTSQDTSLLFRPLYRSAFALDPVFSPHRPPRPFFRNEESASADPLQSTIHALHSAMPLATNSGNDRQRRRSREQVLRTLRQVVRQVQQPTSSQAKDQGITPVVQRAEPVPPRTSWTAADLNSNLPVIVPSYTNVVI